MPKKPSESRKRTRSEGRGEFEFRAGKLLAGNIIALAAMLLLFDDEDEVPEDRQ